ncbi:MAG: response regulator transcription factor [Actinomycetota bacterium]
MADRLRVLVADDEAALRSLIKTNLQFEGFETLTAANGAEALSAIREQQPDIVLLDVMMPVMDGLAVLSELARDEHRHTRVILVTAKTSTQAQLQGWELGCDDYLTKPFDLDMLIDRIRVVWERTKIENEERRRAAIEALRLTS